MRPDDRPDVRVKARFRGNAPETCEAPLRGAEVQRFPGGAVLTLRDPSALRRPASPDPFIDGQDACANAPVDVATGAMASIEPHRPAAAVHGRDPPPWTAAGGRDRPSFPITRPLPLESRR